MKTDKTPNLHRQLRLPSTYHVDVEISGVVNETQRPGREGARRVTLRKLISTTPGTVTVFAMRWAFGDWKEIGAETFRTTATSIVFE